MSHFVLTLHPAHVGAKYNVLADDYVRRYRSLTPAIKPALGRDGEGQPALIYELPTPESLVYAGRAVGLSAKDFWKAVRIANRIPKSNRDLPNGDLFVHVTDHDRIFPKRVLNPKVHMEKEDAHQYAKVGVYHAITKQIPHRGRSRNIGTGNIRKMLSVRVDGK